MEFRVLGSLQVSHDGVEIPVRGRIAIRLLAVLLTAPGQGVSMARLIEGVWDGDPPETAHRQVRHAASRLRKALGDGRVRSAGDGYRLDLDGASVDSRRFAEAVRRARTAAESGDHTEAVESSRAGLRLWRGEPFSGLSGRIIDAEAGRLNELRLAATEDRLEWELDAGDHTETVGELRRLLSDNPYRQRLAGLLMLALYREGRTPEALDVYERIRARFADELGLDPDPALRRRHAAVLRGDPALDARPPVGAAPRRAEPAIAGPVPAQLPVAPVAFTGRDAELRALDAQLDAGRSRSCLVTGAAGAGKTSLAVHWSHRVRDRFGDGQLFVDMRGFDDGEPVGVADAVGRLIRALHGPGAVVPSDVDEAVSLYRTLTDRRRLLVVLDNVRDAARVRPLLPAGDGCFALVTSRNRLTGLTVLDGTAMVSLGTLRREESVALLTDVLGAERLAPEPGAADALAERCGDLPLALRIAAAHLTVHTEKTLAGYGAEMRDGDRLTALSIDGDPDATVTVALTHSHRALDAEARRLFCLLGIVPGDDFSGDLAVAVHAQAGTDRVLDRLETAHLIERHRPGRYRLHDLVREFAAKTAARDLAPADRDAVADRFIDWHYRRRLEPLPDEEDNVMAGCLRLRGHPELWKLVSPLMHPLGRGRRFGEAGPVIESAIANAAADGDALGRFRAMNVLVAYHCAADDDAAAIETARAAVAVAEQVDDASLAGAHANLGVSLFTAGRYTESEEQIGHALAVAPGSLDWRVRFGFLLQYLIVSVELGRYHNVDETERRLRDGFPVEESPQRAMWLDFAMMRRYSAVGSRDRALRMAARVIEVATALPDDRWRTLALLERGALRRRAGEFEAAGRDLREALRLARKVNRITAEAGALVESAILATEIGDHPGAAEYAGVLREPRFHSTARRSMQADIALAWSIVSHGVGEHRTAAHHARQAVTLNSHGPRPLPTARAYLALGRAQAGYGDHTAARESWRDARDRFEELGVPEAENARRLLSRYEAGGGTR
ncbi:DNA-binding SARP family transcriptional activator [Stackebrandtia albiflava]|uniref:DNA-binding SARP family transcriptional activator n=1 Tax=Stackebrandtia albiflava TaxID=406432 RepID=A0A562URM5_9ACTN|nr:BTAD domain-containing putative transcriptional regulator [Stackebrandtia albiflava]TWJ08275.1 DNA-binding SARP family transcriptional activator [Stackebrandtia albiflava]